MKQNLTRELVRELYHYAGGIRVSGPPPDLSGDVSGLRGDVTGLSGDVTGLRGDVTDLSGDVSGLRGDVTSLRGDATGLRGDVTACELTAQERAAGVSVESLISAASEVTSSPE